MSSNGHDTVPDELLLTDVGPVPLAVEELPTLQKLDSLIGAAIDRKAVAS
jgi:hypothetical protein